MDAPLLTFGRGPLEMLHCIRDLDSCARNTDLGQGFIEDPPCGSHERMTSPVLLISWLLPYKHDFGLRTPFAKYSLRGVPPEIASLADVSCLAQASDCSVGWYKMCRSGFRANLWPQRFGLTRQAFHAEIREADRESLPSLNPGRKVRTSGADRKPREEILYLQSL